jgi:hypothetical protein
VVEVEQRVRREVTRAPFDAPSARRSHERVAEPEDPTKRALAQEWEREKQKRRGKGWRFQSPSAPFFIAWIVAGVVAFAVALFAFHVELGAAVMAGVVVGLIVGLRILLKLRR